MELCLVMSIFARVYDLKSANFVLATLRCCAPSVFLSLVVKTYNLWMV